MNKKVNFDNYSDEYLKLMEKQHSKYGDIEYYSQHKAKITKKLFANIDMENILEFGCGIGRNLPFLQQKFKNSTILGSDISTESLEIAKKNNPSMIFLDDNELKEYENKFDLIFIAGVYHHISPELRDDVTKRIKKLLKPNGKLICFEHNPYNPLTRQMVSTCEFDKDAVLLSLSETKKIFLNVGFSHWKSSYTLFVPPKLKKFNFIEPFFGWLPLGGQYYVALENKTIK